MLKDSALLQQYFDTADKHETKAKLLRATAIKLRDLATAFDSVVCSLPTTARMKSTERFDGLLSDIYGMLTSSLDDIQVQPDEIESRLKPAHGS